MDGLRAATYIVLCLVDDALDMLAHAHREVAFRKFADAHADVIFYELPPAIPPLLARRPDGPQPTTGATQ